MTSQWINRFLAQLEKMERSLAREEGAPQFFVTGLPRTGTTLVSQYIAHRLEIAYFTNGVGRHPLAPITVSRWQRWVHPPYQSDFRSEYGRCQGPMAPREAGAFWGYYFDTNRYQETQDVPHRNLEIVRRTVLRVQNVFRGAAFMNKNVKHLLRIKILGDLFPRAIFVIVERPLPDVAVSVLVGRRRLKPDGMTWFSIVPRCHENIRHLPLVQQIPRQLLDIQDKMEEDILQMDPNRILRLPYQKFCENPETFIQEIRKRSAGTQERNSPIASFPQKRNPPGDAEQRRLILELEALLEARNSKKTSGQPGSNSADGVGECR